MSTPRSVDGGSYFRKKSPAGKCGRGPVLAGRVFTIGVDEAGYSPRLGPLVVTGVRLERPAPAGDLYACLAGAVTRARAGRSGPPRPLVIADSKTVYSKAKGLAELERGALSFLRVALEENKEAARRTSTDLALALALSGEALDLSGLEWYGGPPERLPLAADAGDVARSGERLALALDAADACGLTIRSRVITARELNRGLSRGLNKAEFLVEVVAGLLASLTRPLTFGERKEGEPPREGTVLVDRLGGRKDYRALLEAAFPDALIREDLRENAESRYTVRTREPQMNAHRLETTKQPQMNADERRLERQTADDTDSICVHLRSSAVPVGRVVRSSAVASLLKVTFACRAEERCLTVAVASMVSKYVRELFMRRLNRYFVSRVRGLRPTAGYPQDAKRFLAEIAEFRARAGVADELLVRAR